MGKITPVIYTGDQFRRLRKEKKISQFCLAKLAGITQAQISNFELGKRSTTLTTLTKLLTALYGLKSNGNGN